MPTYHKKKCYSETLFIQEHLDLGNISTNFLYTEHLPFVS